jgi:hypothetical protein
MERRLMFMNGKKRLIVLGVVIILLLAMVPVLVSADPLEKTDIEMHKFSTGHVGVRFTIRGNLSESGSNPVTHIAWNSYLVGKPVEIYRRVGSNFTWELLNTQDTETGGGFRLPWTEYGKGKRHYMAVFWGDSTYPGSFDKFTVTIE